MSVYKIFAAPVTGAIPTDCDRVYVETSATSVSPSTLVLPNIAGSNFPNNTKKYYIADIGGYAAGSPITITTSGSDTINGATSIVINTDGGSVSLETNPSLSYGANDWIAIFKGGAGGGTGVQSVNGLNTDNTDPANPVVQIAVDNSTITGQGTPVDPLVAHGNSGTVESVTGLNTDNTDPANPIVKISVDNSTITGLGTPASPLVAHGNSGTVESVTGLNTDNTDPANPIVKISVDNSTITGLGTPASPLIAHGNSGTVESVTGLNTDNTDPANPIVKISVDGVTITGLGTPASPLISTSGGGTVLSVTGLNTDNTDPANPIVKISVDGVTVTGLGTPASPLVSVAGGGTVLSVTGLNTDNTDPTNPIVKVSVDGVTITGLGTPASPLVSVLGSGTVLSVTGLNTDNTDPTNPIVKIAVDNSTITGLGTPASPLVAHGNTGTVESVTGLNTDNTDPTNPIVKISVDGVTVSGLGTPASPLTAVGSGGTVLSVTGLNTDNTDPANPIVKISVDGATIAGLGTPASPLALSGVINNRLFTPAWFEDTVHESGTGSNATLLSYGYNSGTAAVQFPLTFARFGVINVANTNYDDAVTTEAFLYMEAHGVPSVLFTGKAYDFKLPWDLPMPRTFNGLAVTSSPQFININGGFSIWKLRSVGTGKTFLSRVPANQADANVMISYRTIIENIKFECDNTTIKCINNGATKNAVYNQLSMRNAGTPIEARFNLESHVYGLDTIGCGESFISMGNWAGAVAGNSVSQLAIHNSHFNTPLNGNALNFFRCDSINVEDCVFEGSSAANSAIIYNNVGSTVAKMSWIKGCTHMEQDYNNAFLDVIAADLGTVTIDSIFPQVINNNPLVRLDNVSGTNIIRMINMPFNNSSNWICANGRSDAAYTGNGGWAFYDVHLQGNPTTPAQVINNVAFPNIWKAGAWGTGAYTIPTLARVKIDPRIL